MKTVLRIESMEGKGPYYGLGDSWCTRDHGWHSPFAPAPDNDGLRGFNRGFVFGFNTLKQFKQWFACPKELLALHSMGYQLSVYKVRKEALQIGKSQVTFSAKIAKKVVAIPLDRVAKKLATVKNKPKSDFSDDIAF